MAATDHPIVLDLGQVRGLVVTNGKPSDSDGSEGELRIDPSNGNVWKRTGGTWILLCQLALASSILQSDWNQSDSTKKDYIKHKPTIDTALSGSSTNAVQNKAVKAAIDDVIANMTPRQAEEKLALSMSGTGTWDGAAVVLRYGNIVEVRVVSYNTDPAVWKRKVSLGVKGSGTAIAEIPLSCRCRARTMISGSAYVSSDGSSTATQVRCDFVMYSRVDGDVPGKFYLRNVQPVETISGHSVRTLVSSGDVWITGLLLHAVYTVDA